MLRLPRKVTDLYFEKAREHGGTSGMILNDMCAFARKEARELIQAGAVKSEVADEFRKLADECAVIARKEKWTNDYALHIADPVRKAVMSVRT